ncbi:MAG: transposase, partial [Candidatus Electrothrix sp. AU1_5]|nr:transposase [Candidatus Electrothrix gigas]
STIERAAKEEGILQGISKGIEQGRTRGQLEKAQEDVLEVLEVRFGNVPFRVKEEVILCNDLTRLNKAHRHALLIAAVDAFEL